MPEVISNTSPLQYLYQAGLLELLPRLFERVIVPGAVVEELAEGRARGVALPDVAAIDWVQIRRAKARDFLPLVTRLGAGEREALALAVETAKSLLILDDALARRHARLLGLGFTGTLGVLLEAKRSGRLDALTPVLDKLDALGFRLGADTRAAALRLAEESG